LRRVVRHRYCTGYRRTLYIFRTVGQCGTWVRNVNPRQRYFFFRAQSNWHCSPCPSRYRGGTSYTAVDNNTNINIFFVKTHLVENWTRRWAYQQRNRYCGGYKKSAFNHRSIDACGRWVRSVDPEARYFMYRLTGNFHCSPCPMHYNGSTTRTHADNSVMNIYRIVGWRPPTYKWSTKYRRVAIHRYCTGYKKTTHSYRNVRDCAAWVSRTDKEAKWFFFRHQSNWHCSPCPHTYTGHPTTGTAFDKNTRIFIYRIIHWKAPTYVWQKWYRRVVRHRYCTGYRRTLYSFRTVQQCGNWVRQVEPSIRFFFFRAQSNWHCSPCPTRYRGGTSYTAVDNRTNINIFYIRDSRPPAWTRRWHRIVQNRYCGGYKKTNHKLRSIDACGRWVRQVDPEARYFMFRLSGNFHCSPCPMYYNGSTTGTHADNSIMHIYRIQGWSRPTYGW
jgi:hypothetical protein